MSAIFADPAGIPRSAHAVYEEITVGMRVFKTDGGCEIFASDETQG